MKRLLAALLLLVAVLPAQAALFDDEEARKRIEALRVEVNARMDKLEAASRGQIELANQIEALKARGRQAARPDRGAGQRDRIDAEAPEGLLRRSRQPPAQAGGPPRRNQAG
jgi:hypothetical protein